MSPDPTVDDYVEQIDVSLERGDERPSDRLVKFAKETAGEYRTSLLSADARSVLLDIEDVDDERGNDGLFPDEVLTQANMRGLWVSRVWWRFGAVEFTDPKAGKSEYPDVVEAILDYLRAKGVTWWSTGAWIDYVGRVDDDHGFLGIIVETADRRNAEYVKDLLAGFYDVEIVDVTDLHVIAHYVGEGADE